MMTSLYIISHCAWLDELRLQVVFPEGTRISKKTQKSSQAFMKKQGYPELQHLICPRFKGTQDILREVRMKLRVPFDSGAVAC